MSTGASSEITASASLVEINVYAAGVGCDGNMVAGGAAPQLSRSFAQGEPITLDVSPGTHTVSLTAWADAAGTQMIGAGCVADADFQPGQQVCIDLSVETVDLSASLDQGQCITAGCPCDVSDDCDFNLYCDPNHECRTGCKSNSECATFGQPDLGAVDGGVMATNFCEPTRHMCVECAANSDCPVGKLCSPAGACVQGCDLTKGKGCPSGRTCCNNLCLDTKTDPLNCAACGNACDTTHSLGTACNNSLCTFSGCLSNYGDCTQTAPNVNGCETNLSMAGKKVCSGMCVATTTCCVNGDCMMPPVPAACYQTAGTCSGVGGSCSYSLKVGSKICAGNLCCNALNGSCNADCSLTCNAGFADCDADPSNGCEVNLASAGKRLCMGQCIANATCCPATQATDCVTPPSPASCYTATGTCSGVGGSCSYSLKAGSQVCGATCCNAINGSCAAGTCALTCSAGFYDCNQTASDGCEAPGSGLGCCPNPLPAPSTFPVPKAPPGLPMIAHSTGVGGTTPTYYDCFSPVGTSGTSATYWQKDSPSVGMASDASSASISTYPGPFFSLTGGVLTGWTTSGALINWNQLAVCNQSGTSTAGACVCWAYKFCCWNGNPGTACTACPAGVTENSQLCVKDSTINTFAKCGAVQTPNWQTYPSGYVVVNNADNSCYWPSPVFGDQPWN